MERETAVRERISVMVPCFNEEAALPLFREELDRVMSEMSDYAFEVILVDDGSRDQTLSLIRSFSMEDERYRYLSFSRNFGKEAAMLAALRASRGDYVVYMDADLQDPPSLLPEMMRLLKEKGVDSVGTRRRNRKGEPLLRSAFATMFYGMMNRISNVRLIPSARDYRLMTRRMADAVLSLCEYNRFSKGMFEWVGFSTEWISYPNVERAAGKTKFNFWKLFKYSIECIVSFSTAPLNFASVMGLILCLAAFIGIIVVIIRHFAGVSSAFGWPSLMCVVLFVGGVLEFSIGVLGTYLSKTYLEVKHRPIYLIKEQSEQPPEEKN
ncbi:MAG: glycosyltransferase family 2 protein [Clostridia bacterium]|nr:glycosyltransferase family 2 protein [Clostridia bacterium]